MREASQLGGRLLHSEELAYLAVRRKTGLNLECQEVRNLNVTSWSSIQKPGTVPGHQ